MLCMTTMHCCVGWLPWRHAHRLRNENASVDAKNTIGLHLKFSSWNACKVKNSHLCACFWEAWRVNRDVLQTEIRKLRRKRAAAGWEVRNKMAHFRENPSERSARGPWNRTKFSVRFSLAGSSLPMWPCASAVWDCRTPHQLLLFLSLLQLCHHFRDRRALQHQFRLLQLQYVLQLRIPGYYETIDLSLGGCRDSWESLKKCILFAESRGWRGEGKRRRKTTSRIIKLRKGSLPSPLSPSHSPFASTLPHVKQFCCCLVDYQSRPALPCKASQGKKRRSSSPRPLCHFVTREQQGFRQNLLESPQSLRHRNWPNRKWNRKSIFCLQNKLSVRTYSCVLWPCPVKTLTRTFPKIEPVRFAKPP